MPGTLVVVKDFTLVRRFNSEETGYTEKMQVGIVVTLSHVWYDCGRSVEPNYLVMLSNDMRLYYVPSNGMLTPDEATDPGRLFGLLRG